MGSNEFAKIDDGQQKQIQKTILDLKKKVADERFIGNIRDITRTIDDGLYSNQMNLMSKWLTPKTGEGETDYKKTPTYIKKNSIHVEFTKHELTNEEDVDAYVEALKEAYLERIHQNLKITL